MLGFPRFRGPAGSYKPEMEECAMSMSRFKFLVVPLIVISTLTLGACATNQVDRKQATEQKAREMSEMLLHQKPKHK